MQVPREWLDRIKSLNDEARAADLRRLALQCLRLTVPLLDDKSEIEHVIRICDSYDSLCECHSAGISADEIDGVLASKGLMTQAELHAAYRQYSIFIRSATNPNMAITFASLASGQLAAFLDAHMEASLGNAEAYTAAVAKFSAFYKAGDKSSSLLHIEYPEAASKLTALLNGAARAKTLDRLSVFRSFTVHKSFRHVARQADEAADNPDHSGPAYKVRKLGESLGVQLTRLAPGPGRSRTELTPAGQALADWVSSRPDLLS
jgi:hypothetical protein